ECIAARPQLQRLECEQHHDQGHAGVASQQRVVCGQRGADRHDQQSDQPAARWQRARVEREPAAPDQHACGEPAAPQRQVGNLRQDDPADDRQQKQCVARVAGQGGGAGQHALACCGGWESGSAPDSAVTFLCVPKEKSPKERAAADRAAARFLALLGTNGKRANSPCGLKQRALFDPFAPALLSSVRTAEPEDQYRIPSPTSTRRGAYLLYWCWLF